MSAVWADDRTISGNLDLGSAAPGDTETIAVGETWTVDGAGHIRMGNGNNQQSTLNIYGTLYISKSGGDVVTMGNNGNNGLHVITVDGGTVQIDPASSTTTWHIGKDGNSSTTSSTMNLVNGAQFLGRSGSGTNINVEVGRNSTGYLNIDSTSLFESGDLLIGLRNTADVEGHVNVNGGTLNVNNLSMASTHINGGKAYFNVLQGGTATTNNLNMSRPNSTDANSANSWVLVSGLGSKFTVNGTAQIGINFSEKGSGVVDGNSAEVRIATGAQAIMNTVHIRETGQIAFELNAFNPASISTAMFQANSLNLYKSNALSSASFLIEGSMLGGAGGFEAGVVYDFILFTVTNGEINFDGNTLSFADDDFLATLAEYIAFANNNGNSSWEAFDENDLFVDGNSVGIHLKYIPEPGTYAAIFGALALALVAYRRRQ